MNILRGGLAIAILLAAISGMTLERSVGAVSDDSFFTHLHTEKAMANVTVSPARAGPVQITIQLEPMDEKPLTVKAVSVTLANAVVKPTSVAAERRGDGQWLARLSVPKAGQWTLGLGISISDTDKVDVAAPIVIK